MIDKTHILIKYSDALDRSQLEQYGTVISDVVQIRWLYLKLYGSIDSGSALHAIQNTEGVVCAEYNQRFSVDKDSPWLAAPTTGRAVNNRAIYEVIRAFEAWDITTGHPDVVICHLDTGVQQSHPNLRVVYGGTSQEGVLDLAPANNVNRVDVDDMAGEAVGLRPGYAVTLRVYEYNHEMDITGAGGTRTLKPIYSDAACTLPLANPYDLTGISGLVFYMDGQADVFFDLDDGSEYPSMWSYGGIGDTSCFDAVGHGTATVSQINGQHDTIDGVWGIAPGCTTVHFRMSDAMGGGNNMDSVNLMIAAADYPGCKIISNSWGVTDPASPSSLALHDAINYALGKDIIVGFAAGNAGTHSSSALPDYYIYPASWDGVLSVSGVGNPKSGRSITKFIDDSDDFDYFTVNEKVTRNDKVFISAPMAQIAVACPDTSNIYWDTTLAGHGPPSHGRRYATLVFGGTSCAMPIVAGVLGLIYSAARERNITLTSAQAKAYLSGSATPGIKLIGGMGNSSYSGAGIVNAYAGVQSVIAGHVVTAPAVQTESKLRLTQNVTDASRQIVFTLSGTGLQQLTVAVDGTPTNTITSPSAGAVTVTLPALSVGLHDMTATLDYTGGSATISEPVAINPTPGIVYTLPLTRSGNTLRWSVCGVAPTGHTIKALNVSVGGTPVEVFVKGNTLDPTVSVSSGIRSGIIDLSKYPAGSLAYTANVTAYNNSTGVAYNFGSATDSLTNDIGYLSAAPVIAEFSVPRTVSSLTFAVALTATDDNAVTGYLITTSPFAPLSTDTGWTGTAPVSYTVPDYGDYVLYGWVKDADGNISGPYSAVVTVSQTASTPATGTESAAQTGTATATGTGIVTAVGSQATAETGQATANATSSGTAQAVGVQAASETGTATATGSGSVQATGAQATSETGQAIASAASSGTAQAVGVQATGETGAATATGDANGTALGVDISLELGQATAAGGGLVTGKYFKVGDKLYALKSQQGRMYALR